MNRKNKIAVTVGLLFWLIPVIFIMWNSSSGLGFALTMKAFIGVLMVMSPLFILFYCISRFISYLFTNDDVKV